MLRLKDRITLMRIIYLCIKHNYNYSFMNNVNTFKIECSETFSLGINFSFDSGYVCNAKTTCQSLTEMLRYLKVYIGCERMQTKYVSSIDKLTEKEYQLLVESIEQRYKESMNVKENESMQIN